MKIILFLLLFNVYVNSESLKNRAVNLALETVLEFDKKDRASDIKFIDDVQTFLNKIKNVLSKKSHISSRNSNRRVLIPIPLTFIEFLQNIVAILKSYDDFELKKIIKLLQTEIHDYNYKGCKFYELTEEPDVKDMFVQKIKELNAIPLPDLRRRMDEIITELHDRKLSKDHQEIIDYINGLYKPDEPRKLLDVLNNLQVYQTNSKRSLSDLTRIIRHALRNVVFNHYSQLEANVRRGLKIRLEYLAKNANKQILDHHVYDVKEDLKSGKLASIVTITLSTRPTDVYSMVYDMRHKTTRLPSLENSAEYIHLYPRESKHATRQKLKKSKKPKKVRYEHNMLRTVWEEKWTTDPSIVYEELHREESHEIKSETTKPTVTTTIHRKLKNKRIKKVKKEYTIKASETVTATTVKKYKKRHRIITTTEKSTSTQSTTKTKRRKKKKVHKKYIDDIIIPPTENTKKEHHVKHSKKQKIPLISNPPFIEENVEKKYHEKLTTSKLKWKKHDSRYRTNGRSRSFIQTNKYNIYESSKEAKTKEAISEEAKSKEAKSEEPKSSENEVEKPRKKKFNRIVLGMPMALERDSSKETTKRKIYFDTKKKKTVKRKLEKEKELSFKKRKAKFTTPMKMKTRTSKLMPTIDYDRSEMEMKHGSMMARFRVSSNEDDTTAKTKAQQSSCEDAFTTKIPFAVSGEGLPIESFEGRPTKVFVGRRAQNTTVTTQDIVLKRIDLLEKELQDFKHIILDKTSVKPSSHEINKSETAEELEITSYEIENSTEVSTTPRTTSTESIPTTAIIMTTKSVVRKVFEDVTSTLATRPKTYPTIKTERTTKTTTARPTTTTTTTAEATTTIIPSISSTIYQKPIFRAGDVNITERTLDGLSVEAITAIINTERTLSIDELLENFISRELMTKATKKKLFVLKNSTTTTTPRSTTTPRPTTTTTKRKTTTTKTTTTTPIPTTTTTTTTTTRPTTRPTTRTTTTKTTTTPTTTTPVKTTTTTSTINTTPITELNATKNRLNATNILRMSNNENNDINNNENNNDDNDENKNEKNKAENIEEIIKKRLDFYYEDDRRREKQQYDDLILDDLREDGANK